MQFNEKRDFLATRRSDLLTQADIEKFKNDIFSRFNKQKILVIGGAGSIGSSFVQEIVNYYPKYLHIIDPNENGLTNLVRNLRSKDSSTSDIDLITSPLDFGSRICEQFIYENGPYDYVFNFAAIKHVRSEKDLYSLIQMFDTNVIKHANLLNYLTKNNISENYFAVSTDKAANPVSLMGASKKIMELVLQGTHLKNRTIRSSTTRFANVAFSNGSLLQSFETRFLKNEPLVSPKNIMRYFVSHKEAAEICILASTELENGDILVPKISNDFKLYPISKVAENFITDKNLTPVLVNSKNEAYEILEKNNELYPIILTQPDTSGEKDFEEFLGKDEEILESKFLNFDVVKKSNFNAGELVEFIEKFNALLDGSFAISKQEIIDSVKNLVKNLNHIDTGKNLDSRM
tara:strand:+ start:1074 stop:2285 length:1212 start_codon:yes stop_codon:yes gene_type:complete